MIVESWEMVENINAMLDKLGAKGELGDNLDIDDVFDWSETSGWGFSDEYSTCGHCYNAFRTSPDSYVWKPDYWVDYDNCEMVCGDCVREDFAEDYIEYLVKKTKETGDAQACTLLDPTDYGFSLVVENLENGLHHDQADDPKALVSWAMENSLEPVFAIYPSQFYVTFDLYLRRPENPLSDSDIADIRSALLVDPTDKYTALRSDFREFPTPAQRMEAGLKNPKVHKVSRQDFIDGKALNHGLDGVVRIEIED